MTLYVIEFGEYANRSIGGAFTTRAAAEEYQARRTATPLLSLGPSLPITIVEVTVYKSAQEAIDSEVM